MNAMLAAPEIAMALSALGILVFGVTRRTDPTAACAGLTVGAFLLAAVLVVGTDTGVAFTGQFTSDRFAAFLKLLILAGAAMSLILSLDYNVRAKISRFEFPVLMLLATTGMLVMVSASNMMTLYLGLELQSLAMYVLAAFARDDVRSSEAGLKYFVLGALASGLLLYGISLVYGFSGTLDFQTLAQTLQGPDSASYGLVVGIIFVVAGLAFKISAVPFHMWTPDVYEGAPAPVTSFMAGAPKIAAIGLLLRVMIGPFGHLVGQWQAVVELISIGSMLLGALAAIGQTNIKRLMAYSSIGHMGYALIGLAAGTEQGVRGVLIYLLTYLFMNAGTFAILVAMRRNGRPLERIADLGGLARTDPMLAAMMAVFMFSMTGIPPMAGFLGKLFVFLAAVDAGMWTLATIGVLTSVVGGYYYLRVIKVMYFDDAEAPFDARPAGLSVIAAGSAVFTLLLFVPFGAALRAAEAASRSLF